MAKHLMFPTSRGNGSNSVLSNCEKIAAYGEFRKKYELPGIRRVKGEKGSAGDPANILLSSAKRGLFLTESDVHPVLPAGLQQEG